LLSIIILDDSRIFDFVVQVRDDNGLLNRKNYQVPAEILFEYEVEAGNDDKVNYFDTVSVSFTVKNISPDDYNNVKLSFSSSDPYYTIIKDFANLGFLGSNQSRIIDSALVMIAYPGMPDQYISNISCIVSSDEKQWNSNVYLVAHSPDFKLAKMEVIDNHNGILDPGEVAQLKFQITNSGHMDIENIEVELESYQNLLEIEDPVMMIDQDDDRSICNWRNGNYQFRCGSKQIYTTGNRIGCLFKHQKK